MSSKAGAIQSPGCRGNNTPPNRWAFVSILNGPSYNLDQTISLAAVFQFVLDPSFREAQLNQLNQVVPLDTQTRLM